LLELELNVDVIVVGVCVTVMQLVEPLLRVTVTVS